MNAADVAGTRFQTNLGELTLDSPINYGGAGRSYRARCGDRWLVLELVDQDARPGSRYVAAKVRRRVKAYAALSASGVPVPRLLDHDVSRGYLVKEYLVGANVGETLTRGRLGNGVVDQFGALMQLLKQHGLTIDWSPANFLVVNGALHYTAYEAIPQRPDARAERQAMAPGSFGVYPA
jgi:hypothetical protein